MDKHFLRNRIIRFRQFSNKAYAAFRSLHREVTIGQVSGKIAGLEMLKQGRAVALTAAALCSAFVFADVSDVEGEGGALTDHRQLSLQEVQVVAHKAEVQSDAFRLVTQVSREEIESLPVQTVADILQYLPGLDVRTRGACGSQADVSMRGGTFDQVIVMLNGVTLNDAHTGHYALNLPVTTDIIERIEVLQGTGTSLFGINALSGAVNIITSDQVTKDQLPRTDAKKSSAKGVLRLTAGMNGLVNPAATLRWQQDDRQVNASAEYSRADGYYAPEPSAKEQTALTNSDIRLANIYVQARYRGLDLQAGAQYKDAGAGMFYGFGSQDQFDATRTAFGSAAYRHTWQRLTVEAQASYRANYDRYEWHRGQRLYGNFHFSQNSAVSAKLHYASQVGRTSVGVELRNENLHSTNLGDTVNPSGMVPNVDGFNLRDLRVLELVKGKNRLNVNYYAEQAFVWNDLTASLGVSGNWNTMFGNNFAGGANIGYRYAPQSSVYLNANRSLRMPTFTDLYYNAGNQLGNRDLKPEEAWLLSLGTKYCTTFQPIGGNSTSSVAHSLTLTADAYYRWGRNIIDWVYVPTDTKRPFHAQNQQKVNAAGCELAVVYTLNDWLRRVSLSYAYTWLDLDLKAAGSRYLDYLSHKVVLQLEHALYVLPRGKGVLCMQESLRWQKREGEYNDADGVVQAYRPVLLLDATLFWQNDKVRVSAECTNLTNRRYYDYGGLLQPGAWAKMSLQAIL